MCMDAGDLVRMVPRPEPEMEIRHPIPLETVDAIDITVLVDNGVDVTLLDQGPAKRPPLGTTGATVEVDTLLGGRSPDMLRGEHGFSALLTVTRGEATCRVLFDTGVSPDGMVANMRRLDMDPGDVDVIVLSHGHFDHCTGLDGFIRAVGRPNLPVLVHPDAWLRRRVAIPGREPVELPTTSRSALEGAGFEIIERPEPSLLLDGALLVTGEVDRSTAFEQGFPIHEANRDGAWGPDQLIHDSQAIVAHVRGQGLVVLTGCGHAGVVNIVRHARRLTGVHEIHTVLGGFHLGGPLFAPIIGPTVDHLAQLAPDWIVPAHCTGLPATAALAARMPDALIENTVGTRYELRAA